MAEAREALQHVIGRDPHQLEVEQARWRLSDIRKVCDWLEVRSSAGLSKLLTRLDIHYKRARAHVHSPDPDYLGKLAAVRAALQAALAAPDQVAVLFLDEFSYTRQPTLARAYADKGHTQALAELGHTTNREGRIVGALEALSGRVIYQQHGRITVPTLVRFYQSLVQAYPTVQTLYLVLDNWPVHFHPDVLAALQPQTFPWPIRVSPTWPKEASARAKRLNLPIRLLPLPTYASWTNPIEKLWRQLRQEVLHLHRFEDDWAGLKAHVATWLDGFQAGSPDLLRYVGLADPTRLYHAAMLLYDTS